MVFGDPGIHGRAVRLLVVDRNKSGLEIVHFQIQITRAMIVLLTDLLVFSISDVESVLVRVRLIPLDR